MQRTATRVGIRRRLLTTIAAALMVGSIAAVTAAPVAAAALVVTDAGDTVNDDLACTLREAIEAANTDAPYNGCPAGSGADTITFDPAVSTVTLGSGITISTDITISGAGQVTVDGTDTFRLFSVSGGTSTFDSLRMTDGSSTNYGGAIFVAAGATVTVQGSEFSSNGAAGTGGALGALGTLHVLGSTFTANTAPAGGAIGLNGGNVTVERSSFDANEADYGGAIYGNAGALDIIRSVFLGNTATMFGGALFLDMGSATTTVRDSTINANTAADGAGIQANSPLTVVNSTLWGNTASGSGGAIWRSDALTLIHATIATNAANGGATAGGGIFTDDGSPAMTVRNSVIAGNTNGDSATQGTVPSPVATNSQIGLGGKTLDDLFDEAGLQDNGGPTKTVMPAAVAGNPLRGGASTTYCTGAPASAKDQRGFGRTAPCDIGAVELDTTKPVTSGAKASLRRDVALGSGTRLQVRLTWSASDVDSGVASYTIQRSVNGATYTTIGTSTTRAFNTTLASGTTYRFRVRATDKEGNVGSYASTATFTARLVQQTSSSVTYRGTWRTSTSSVFSGGSARRSSTAGSSVTYTGTGRSFAFVSTVGPGRGKAKVYVDGTLRETIDLGGSSPATYRVQVWSRTYSTSASHRVRIVVVGTSGRPRVDADAFAVLR